METNPNLLKSAAHDDDYITAWLLQFEQALDDSTLVSSYRQMRSIE